MVKTIVILFIFALGACSNDMYLMLHRSTSDPITVNPKVESFLEPNTIFISWDYDEGADEYILQRAKDGPVLHFETMYRGIGLSFTDRYFEIDRDDIYTMYIYRLLKRRGSMIFGPSTGALGVSSIITSDIYGNSSRDRALRIESIDYIANMFYFRSHCGIELFEDDWFYIDVPPLRQAAIVVFDYEVPPGGGQSHFMYLVYTRESNPVVHNHHFWIINTELETRRFYFKLFPNRTRFLDGSGAGGKIVQYRISLHSITPIRIGG